MRISLTQQIIECYSSLEKLETHKLGLFDKGSVNWHDIL